MGLPSSVTAELARHLERFAGATYVFASRNDGPLHAAGWRPTFRHPAVHTAGLYRCEFGARRYVPVGLDHPPTVYVREDAIVPRLDAWLAEIVTPEALASAQAMPPDVAALHVGVRTAMDDCDLSIKRLLESIESGIDRELVAPGVRQLQAERSRLEATLGLRNQWRQLSAHEIAEWADSLGGVIQVL